MGAHFVEEDPVTQALGGGHFVPIAGQPDLNFGGRWQIHGAELVRHGRSHEME